MSEEYENPINFLRKWLETPFKKLFAIGRPVYGLRNDGNFFYRLRNDTFQVYFYNVLLWSEQ